MDNYEAFKTFLDENKIHYMEDKLEQGDRFIRIPQKLKNGGVVNVIVVFAAKNIKVLIVGIANVDDEGKRGECLKLFNSLNAKYNFFKLYMQPNGDIALDGDVVLGIFEGDFQTRALMGFIIAALNYAQDVYKDVMKVLWA
ncbi:MAG: YbjN domain-containing protein [Selenomonadaceae bacterium]|nr:YbjN domain-containing protein [Selenomonadaceae bacterium]